MYSIVPRDIVDKMIKNITATILLSKYVTKRKIIKKIYIYLYIYIIIDHHHLYIYIYIYIYKYISI